MRASARASRPLVRANTNRTTRSALGLGMPLSQAAAQQCCTGRLPARRRVHCVCASTPSTGAQPGRGRHAVAAPSRLSLSAPRSSTLTRAAPLELVAAVADSASPASGARTVVAVSGPAATALAPPSLLSASQLLLVIFVIVQGPKGEGMINKMNGACGLRPYACASLPSARSESRMFGNFTQTKNFVSVGTWGLIGGFLLLSAVTALKLH